MNKSGIQSILYQKFAQFGDRISATFTVRNISYPFGTVIESTKLNMFFFSSVLIAIIEFLSKKLRYICLETIVNFSCIQVTGLLWTIECMSDLYFVFSKPYRYYTNKRSLPLYHGRIDQCSIFLLNPSLHRSHLKINSNKKPGCNI